MEIIRTIRECFQNAQPIEDLYNFECKNNWDYEIELDNLVHSERLANFLHRLDQNEIKYEIGIQPTDRTWKNWKMVITFPKKEDK